MTTVKLSKNLQNPRGVYSIPVTPFHEDGKLDLDSLRKCIEFCLEKGAHGIVMPVNASEVSTLTDEERAANKHYVWNEEGQSWDLTDRLA